MPLPERRPGRLALLLVGLTLIASALISGAVYYFETGESPDRLFNFDNPRDEVLILVVTHPHRADLYVDGVLQKRKSLQLARVRKHVVLRAEAEGFYPTKRSISLIHTRVIHLTLKSKIPRRRLKDSKAGGQKTHLNAAKVLLSPNPQPGAPVPQREDEEKAPIE